MARPPKTPKDPQPPEEEPQAKPQRQPATPGVTDRLSLTIRQLRVARRLTLYEAASKMMVGGQPHSAVAGTLRRIEQEGDTRDLRNQLGKAWARTEDGRQAHTDSSLLAQANALEVDVAILWQSADLSKRQFSTEDAILTDRRLNGAARQAVLTVYHAMVRDVPEEDEDVV